MDKKYEMTEERRVIDGHVLHRIRYISTFRSVRRGTPGGWIEHAGNLCDDALATGEAMIYGDARVCGHAQVGGMACVCGQAIVCGTAHVTGQARISGQARIYGQAHVAGDAHVRGMARVRDKVRVAGCVIIDGMADIRGNAIITKQQDFVTFHNWWADGQHTTWTRSNGRWKTGEFYGTDQELLEWAQTECPEEVPGYEGIMQYVNQFVKHTKDHEF